MFKVINFYSILFAGIAVSLMTFSYEYIFNDLLLAIKIVLNVIAVVIGILLGVIVKKEV